MHLQITDHQTDTRHNLVGTEDQIKAHLCQEYPWLARNKPLKDLVSQLDKIQYITAVLHEDFSKSEDPYHYVQPKFGLNNQAVTRHPDEESYLKAVEMMCGHAIPKEEYRRALLETDGEIPQACLIAAFLDLDLVSTLDTLAVYYRDQEPPPLELEDPVVVDVKPLTQSGQKFCDMILRGYENQAVKHVQLGGKHSNGCLEVSTVDGALLLKPGSGAQNPALGESETKASMTKREACFYSLAGVMQLTPYLPECHAVEINGKEYAAEELLAFDYRNFNDLKKEDPNLPKRLFNYYNDGTLHRWAYMDYILGNPDRNAGNVMASKDTIKLIDHGSAFAGEAFNPPADQYSFVPYYLRAVAPAGFAQMSVEEKLKWLPRVNKDQNEELKGWLLKLNPEIFKDVMALYGIDPQPVVNRMGKITAGLQTQDADLCILAAWVVG